MGFLQYKVSGRVRAMKNTLDELPNFYKAEYLGVLSNSKFNLKHDEKPQTQPLHATILMLRLLGRMPLSRTKSGEFSFNKYSWWTIYCLISMATQIGMTIHVFKEYYLSKEKWSSFDTTVTSLMNASLLLTMSHPVLFTWRHSHSIAEALNRWKHLQASFRVVTANQVSSLLLDHSYFGVVLLASYFVLFEFIPVMLHFVLNADPREKPSIYTIAVFFVAIWYTKLVMWFWLVFTHSISQAARTLKASLAETMARDPSVRRLRLHRSLWLELHNYTRYMTAAVGNTVSAWLVNLVFSLYLSMYATAMGFVSGTINTSMIIPLMAGALQTFLLNNVSYLADDQIGRGFIVKIFSFNYREFSEDQLEEVELFLYTIENSPERFFLEEMVEPSRQTIIDILELALTIMVVLLQFRVST